jgi:hypothetical protein
MKIDALALTLTTLAFGLGACSKTPKDAREIVADIDRYRGDHVAMKAKFFPGVRCRLETEDGEWVTYCGDCQVCKGPYVVDVEGASDEVWPLVLAGIWERRDIRCTGPLNDIECHPFEIGETYIVEGTIDRSNPPKLFVDDFREVEDD